MSKYKYFNKLALLIIIRQHMCCAGLKESREKKKRKPFLFVPHHLCRAGYSLSLSHIRDREERRICTQTMHFAHCKNWDSKCDENNMKTFNVIRCLDAWAKVTSGFRFIRNGSKIRNPTVNNNNKESVRGGRDGVYVCRRKFDLQSFATSMQSQTISLLAPISWFAQSSCTAKSVLIIWFWYQDAHTHSAYTIRHSIVHARRGIRIITVSFHFSFVFQ